MQLANKFIKNKTWKYIQKIFLHAYLKSASFRYIFNPLERFVFLPVHIQSVNFQATHSQLIYRKIHINRRIYFGRIGTTRNRNLKKLIKIVFDLKVNVLQFHEYLAIWSHQSSQHPNAKSSTPDQNYICLDSQLNYNSKLISASKLPI